MLGRLHISSVRRRCSSGPSSTTGFLLVLSAEISLSPKIKYSRQPRRLKALFRNR